MMPFWMHVSLRCGRAGQGWQRFVYAVVAPAPQTQPHHTPGERDAASLQVSKTFGFYQFMELVAKYIRFEICEILAIYADLLTHFIFRQVYKVTISIAYITYKGL